MARFYQTAQPNFVDNFIFEPNWNMAQMALQKQDTAIQDQLDTLDLFSNLPVDYWRDVDAANVQQIQDEYSSRVDDITKQMQGDLLNSGKNRQLINQLRRDIQKDYSTGRLSQIQANAKAARDFDAKLETITDPALRQAYRTQMIDEYRSRVGEQGGLAEVFNPGELTNRRDIANEWIGSPMFKAMEADVKNSKVSNINGQWIITNTNGKEELLADKISQNFAGWFQGQNLGPYAQAMQRYAGEQWLDDSGQFRTDSGSYLGNIMQNVIPSLAYSKTTTGRDYNMNPVWAMNEREQQQIRAEKRAQAREDAENAINPLVEGNVNASAMATTNQAVRNLNENYVESFKDRLYGAVTGQTPMMDIRTGKTYYPNADGSKNSVMDKLKGINTIESLISYMEGNQSLRNSPLLQEAKQRQKQVKDMLKAGNQNLIAMGIDPSMADRFTKQHRDMFNRHGENFQFSLNDLEYVDEDGGRKTRSSKEKFRNMKPSDFVGKKVYNPYTKKEETVTFARIVPNSSDPVFVNPNLEDNGAIAQIEFFFGDRPINESTDKKGKLDLMSAPVDLEDQPSFKRSVNYYMKEATGAVK